jgi:hypothetical protein
MREELEQQKETERATAGEEAMKELLLKKDQQTGLEVKEIKGQGYSQTEFSQKADTLDPRIGGTKIIFDSRLGDVTKTTEDDQLRAFMKIRADEKKKKEPRMSELDQQKLMLQRMMEQERAERDLHYKQKYGEREREEGQGGFQRQQNTETKSLRP